MIGHCFSFDVKIFVIISQITDDEIVDFLLLPQNDSSHLSSDCDQFCTCMEGELSCFSYSCDANANCTIEGGVRDCHCNKGYIGNGGTCRKGIDVFFSL